MKSYDPFDERLFLRSVRAAIEEVSKILDTEARPVRLLAADETEHSYDDKYTVAESLTSTLQQAVMAVLHESLGLTPEHQTLFDKWRKNKDHITLRFFAKDSCTFVKENDVEVKDGTFKTEVTKSGGFLGGSHSTRETTSYRTIKEYQWKVNAEYKISVYSGNDVEGGLTLKERSSETILATQTKHRPLPASTLHPVAEAPLTWFADQKFSIDRSVSDPITPRQNKQVEAALEACGRMASLSSSLHRFFVGRLQRSIMDSDRPVLPRTTGAVGILPVGATGTIQGLLKEPKFNGSKVKVIKYANGRYEVEALDPNAEFPKSLALKANNLVPDQAPTTGPSLDAIQDDTIVVPIIPVLDDEATTTGTTALSEHSRTLRRAVSDLEKWYPNARLVKMITSQEAVIVLTSLHLETLLKRYKDAVAYIEATLRKQLVTAIGKEVSSKDFQAYMQYHYRRRLFSKEYQPVPLCRAIGRPGCFPDGTFSLEQVIPGENNSPVSTWVRKSEEGSSFYIPIHAAASVELTGPKYLHGWMQHRFSSDEPKFQLACRARQFSSFLVVLGTISGPDTFDPHHAIIVHNKDELLIPLMADPLPSAKEFKDAIQSLSPEQQEFAKEFRSMQLSSSVFGVCVVQLKPQLEKLLGIPNMALTKEIQLTQDLMSLFIDHQIPSDMLTYSGPQDAPSSEKVAAVKGYVKSVLDVIEESKKNQLKEEERRADMRGEKAYAVEDADVYESLEAASEDSGVAEMVISKAKHKRASRHRMLASGSLPPGQSIAMSTLQAPMAKMATFSCAAAPAQFGSAPAPPGAELMMLADSVQVGGGGAHDLAQATETGKTGQPDPLKDFSDMIGESSGGNNVEDFTMIPKILDGKLERLDTDGALRSTIIKAGETWSRNRQDNLLTDAKTSSLSKADINDEKKKAFDLLDAISRSGSLSVECSELHLFVAVSHCFDNDVMDTVIKRNVNPIAKVERSAILLASTAFGVETNRLIGNERDVARLSSAFPLLFDAGAED